jgi:regulator of replication initiation timing
MDKEMKTMIREIREDTAAIRVKNKVLRKELTAVREENGEQRRKREREEGGTSAESTDPLRKSSRTGRSPGRSEEGNQSKKIDK